MIYAPMPHGENGRCPGQNGGYLGVPENKFIASVPLCRTPCTLREGKAVIGNWFQVDYPGSHDMMEH